MPFLESCSIRTIPIISLLAFGIYKNIIYISKCNYLKKLRSVRESISYIPQLQ